MWGTKSTNSKNMGRMVKLNSKLIDIYILKGKIRIF